MKKGGGGMEKVLAMLKGGGAEKVLSSFFYPAYGIHYGYYGDIPLITKI